MIRTLKKRINIKKHWLDLKVRRRKSKRTEGRHQYCELPKVSFIIQSFNHRGNIRLLANRLINLPYQECIICEDGSVDGSLQAWLRYFDRPNDFIIHSNDLHEIRTYDRAIRYANGEIICLLQDDEAPPSSPSWFEEALILFEQNPKLVMLGGWLGFQDIESDVHGQKKCWSTGDLTNQYNKASLYTQDEGPKYRFVEGINIGPLFIRREPFVKMGGFDLDFSPVGWPGIHFDTEMSLKTWLHGGQVAWYDAGFRQAGIGGTQSFGNLGKRKQQLITNHGKLIDKYSDRMNEIHALVREAESGRTE